MRTLNRYPDSSDEKKLKWINNIFSSSQTLEKLISEILLWSQSQSNKIKFDPQPIDLFILSDYLKSLFKDAAEEKSIDLVVDISENLTVYADSYMLNIIIRNLVSNAIKFTHNGGSVRITCNANSKYKEICVFDTGIGMDKHIINNLFTIDNCFSREGTSGEQGSGL